MNCTATVITATFNSQNTLEATIRSVLAQTYRDFEYIIIDGLSTDRTVDIIRSFEPQFAAKGIAFQWISEKDSGIYDAWNKGLGMSHGSWISFVGSDDTLRPEALETMSNAAAEDVDFLSAKARLLRNGSLMRTFGEAWNWSVFRREMKILHAGGWHNARYFERFGLFDVSFRIVGDYELLMRAGSSLRVRFVDSYIIDMGADGVSSTMVKKSLKEVQQAKVKNGLRTALQARIDYYWVLFKIKVKSYTNA